MKKKTINYDKFILRLNFLYPNYLVGFISYQISCISAISNPIFRWNSCKGSE